MTLSPEKSLNMKMRDMEAAFRYRRIPYPKRSVELIALLAISCTFFLFMHTSKLNSRLKEMEMKLQPSEFSALGLSGSNHLDSSKNDDINTLHGTYQYLKSTGQLETLQPAHLNNTAKAEKQWVFFNRLEKVGSQSMNKLLRKLGQVNDFVAHTQQTLTFSNNEEETKAKELNAFNKSLLYSEHINWINFTKYDLPKPIYINLIRHPIHRVMSAYYYIRKPSVFAYYVENFNRTQEDRDFFETSFNDCVKQAKRRECIFEDDSDGTDWRISPTRFCGNENVCYKFNSKAAVQLAKRNIEQEYAVVGSWEETSITLTVLEHYIPRYFKNATNIYYSESTEFKINVTPHNTTLEPEVEAKLNKQFDNEIDLYYFCKQRLYKQYIAIKREEMMKEDI